MIIKERERDLYYSIKDNLDKYKDFVYDKLGYDLIVRDEFIKLEKIPSIPEAWMGISDFTDKKEYIFLLNILMFLEDKNKEDQFVLSNITEYIEGAYIYEKIDWVSFSNRKSLIKVMKFAIDIGIIKRNDGSEESFAKNENADVLYESTGFSRYIVRRFSKELDEVQSYEDLLKESFGDMNESVGTIRRNKAYRKLLLSPIIYNNDEEANEYEYIKNYRNSVINEFEKNLEWDLHIHKNGIMAVLNDTYKVKDVFPSRKGEAMVTLFVNKEILHEINSGQLIVNEDDTIKISKDRFKEIILEAKRKYGSGFTKEYRDYGENTLVNNILNFMKSFSMIKEEKEDIILLPLIGKVIGEYPADYKGVEDSE